MGAPIKIADLAAQMIRLAGFRPNKDIKIVYTGLRPGEKLFEELSYPNERIVNVNVPGMYALASGQGQADDTVKLIENAIELAGADNQEAVRRAIEAIVPEYQPSLERKAPLVVALPANEGGKPLPRLREV
jgi:O-antigen biosynthesis protein WbqV